jgi:hypothetical protein
MVLYIYADICNVSSCLHVAEYCNLRCDCYGLVTCSNIEEELKSLSSHLPDLLVWHVVWGIIYVSIRPVPHCQFLCLYNI